MVKITKLFLESPYFYTKNPTFSRIVSLFFIVTRWHWLPIMSIVSSPHGLIWEWASEASKGNTLFIEIVADSEGNMRYIDPNPRAKPRFE